MKIQQCCMQFSAQIEVRNLKKKARFVRFVNVLVFNDLLLFLLG